MTYFANGWPVIPLIGMAAANQSRRALDDATRRVGEAATRTPHSAADWINLAADLASSGITMGQLRMMAAVMNSRKGQS